MPGELDELHRWNIPISIGRYYLSSGYADQDIDIHIEDDTLVISSTVEKDDFKKFLKILAPFAPHIAEDLWQKLGEKKTIHNSEWPKWNKNLIRDDEIKIVIQINGKVRNEMLINADESEEEIKKRALSNEKIKRFISEKEKLADFRIAGWNFNLVTPGWNYPFRANLLIGLHRKTTT